MGKINFQVEGVVEVESSLAQEEGTLIVAAHPDTMIRDLMEAVRKLVCTFLSKYPCHSILFPLTLLAVRILCAFCMLS
jgi:hypothetical protein